MGTNKSHTVAIKINVIIETFAMVCWFGKTDSAGKKVEEPRYRATATIYGHEISSTEFIYKTEKAAINAAKSAIADENA